MKSGRVSRHSKNCRVLLVVTPFLMLVPAVSSVPAAAMADHAAGAVLQSTPRPSPQPTPGAPPVPPSGSSAPLEGTPSAQPNAIQQIVRHTITFSTSSLIDAITEAFVELSRKSMDGTVRKVLPAMDSSMAWVAEVDEAGLSKFPRFEAAVRNAWNAVLKAALVFAPLVLALAVLAILGGGGSAAEMRAETITQALQVLISYAGAAASFYLLSLAIRASWGLTAFIWQSDLGVEAEPVHLILSGLISLVSGALLGMALPLFGVYLLFFFVFTILALLGALGLALAAGTALLALGVIVAPLMLGLGSIPQFRWLTWTWTRLMTGVLLLPVLNAILLKVTSVMLVTMMDALGGGQLGSALLGFFVVAGALSLVIGINYKVGQLVFGPLMEVHRKALAATKAVAALAAAAATVALGGPGLLKAGLGFGGPLRSGGAVSGGGGGGGGLLAGNDAELGSQRSPLTAGVRTGLPPRAASAALSALASMSGNPLVRGALSAAAQGFNQAARAEGGRPGPAGVPVAPRLSPPGGVYSVSARDAAGSILGKMGTPESVTRLAEAPRFQSALRSARQVALGLERAGILLADQAKEAGFPDAASYLGGLAYQVGYEDLQAALVSAFRTASGPSPGVSPGEPRPSREAREVLRTMGEGLEALGAGGFPGAEGRMRILKGAGWWSFNPPPSDPAFSRYAQAFLLAGHHLAEAGGERLLARLEEAVQQARGSPSRDVSPADHFARIQDRILSGDFGEHQEALARIFETAQRRSRG